MSHNPNLIIRLETPNDHYAVEAMTRDAFWRFWEPGRTICEEHLLVHRLRNAPSFVPELNFVAESDGELAGHIIYAKSKVIDNAGNETETLTFGPLTVAPPAQGRGIGQALMYHSFAEAKRLGYPAVLIFGHPDYYPRVGFRPAAEFGITTADGKSFDPFMARPLYDGALDGVQGRYFIDPVYMSLTQEDTRAFDERFPPKEPFHTTPMTVLLDLLPPDVSAALAKTGCQSLQMMTAVSEREVSALPGMDRQTVELIRTVLQENGVKWGRRRENC